MPCLQPQQPAPFFKTQAVVNGEFKEVSLEDYKGKYLVLFFYPLDFTFVCPTEIIAFSEAAQKFRDINCEVSAGGGWRGCTGVCKGLCFSLAFVNFIVHLLDPVPVPDQFARSVPYGRRGCCMV